MRLDRYVSIATHSPRSEVTRLIRGGHVKIGTQVVKDGGVHVTVGKDAVQVKGQALEAPGTLVLMMHKPQGVVTTTEEGAGPTVMGLIPRDLQRKALAPIGRLDKDTTGLLLLTTDGDLNHALTHPRRHVERAYRAELAGELCSNAEAQFEQGVQLQDGTLCQPATLERLGPVSARIVLREGRYHQVKRMVAACGSTVLRLHRERIGQLWLDPLLPPGSVRRLDGDELQALGVAWPQDTVESA